MAELIADLDRSIVDSGTGREYFVNVVGAPRADATWDVWLEFVPPTDDVPLVTGTETHQHSHADAVRWAAEITDVFLQGAFKRAAPAVEPRVAAILPAATRLGPAHLAGAALDPFQLLKTGGKTGLRLELQRLTREELLSVIDDYDLNPPRHSLARLTDRQLVIWIITATEIQATTRLP
jgi:hypothetical protein